MNACNNCTRGLIAQREWSKASTAQRSLWLAAGLSTHQAHGLCRGCYLRAWHAGAIEHTRPGVGGRGRRTSRTAPHGCHRCGITTSRATECRDCEDVAA